MATLKRKVAVLERLAELEEVTEEGVVELTEK